MDSSAISTVLTDSAACQFWTAHLNFTYPISARHFCLLGNNRYVSPPTIGACNEASPSAGYTCKTCYSWDGLQQRDDCHYLKGQGSELGMIPPSSGYDDLKCPVGYEKFSEVSVLDIGCPIDSVLVLEIFPTTILQFAPISDATTLDTTATTTSTTTTTTTTTTTIAPSATSLQELYHAYDFTITTPHDVTRDFEGHQCLTGSGGRHCGEDTLTLLAYHHDGNCHVEFKTGKGYKVNCDNGFENASSLMGAIGKQDCYARNGLTCLEVMQNAANSQTDIQILDGDDLDDDETSGLCGIDKPESLANPLAWLIAAGFILLTLVPSFSQWRTGTISPTFLVGLLSEAIKNGFVVASIVSVEWHCFSQYGLITPEGNHNVFLPYALIFFSLADNLLTIVAMVSRRGRDLETTFDDFKWVESDSTLYRQIVLFLNIVIVGGLSGFCQLVLILEGPVDNPDSSNSLSTWSSWVFIGSAVLGSIFGTLLMLYGLFTGNLRMAWKTYKILVGDIPGCVSSLDLAVALSPGWVAETFNDILHLVLYLPPLVSKHEQQ